MTFVEALTVLGVKKATSSLKKRYTINPQLPVDCKTKKWGIYCTNQINAYALGTVLGCEEEAELHGSGMYYHYHDAGHHIHIWFGYPITIK